MKKLVEVIYHDKKDRCVVATKHIKKGTSILCDHVVLLPYPSCDPTDSKCNSIANRYVFEWDKKKCALSLGLSSLINHHPSYNVRWVPLFECRMIEIEATKDICKGEELVFDYGYNIKFKPLLPIKEN